ncbi:MAG: 4-hydroxy-tetrahydrodipicolinate reductase [Polyangiales bacterium]
MTPASGPDAAAGRPAGVARHPVLIHGAGGRMGQALLRLSLAHPRLTLVAAIDRPGSARLGQDIGPAVGRAPVGLRFEADLDAALQQAAVVVDFSTPSATALLLAACQKTPRPLLIGTTGLDADTHTSALAALSTRVPVLQAANTSVGVHVLRHIAREAARLLGAEYDAEVVEMHHRHKVDAPSGTALALAEALAEAKGLSLAQHGCFARHGQVGPRPGDEVGVMTLRGGDVVGEHTVLLAGPMERLELSHRAHHRDLFAHGALRAAQWLVEQPAGRYGMADVLGLR